MQSAIRSCGRLEVMFSWSKYSMIQVKTRVSHLGRIYRRNSIDMWACRVNCDSHVAEHMCCR